MPQTNYLALERVIHAMIGVNSPTFQLLTPPLTPDVDLKKAAKLFAQKFATGASVTKNPQGQDEIVVQGDVTDDIVEMIEEQVGVLKGVPEDNVVCIEEKKKKAAE
ncbi:Translation machinery-associated protein 22 [Ceratobasidium sp. 428]|nr:Translation machinery-associated protein 22 [Ceratobasidium sp. 428]